MDPSHLPGSSSSPTRDHTRGVRFAEGQPEHHIYQPQPRRPSPRTSPRNSPTHGKAPEVYWADDDREDDRRNTIMSVGEESKYTFFREGTPTPPEYNDEHEKGLAAERAAAGSAAAGSYATRSTVPDSLPPSEGSRGCIGRYQQRWAWVLVLGYQSRRSPPRQNLARQAYSDCPAANNTMHRIPGLAKSFLRLCGVDYSADDLGNFLAGSMAECIDACAAMERCTGCSWGYLDGDKGNKHRCWLKGNLGTPREEPSDWCFAMIPR
ncbi:hypothetical protein B0T20DRAFT_365746 [Sordaria brevicollis]|uniref:Apple domain-containing protein n=1 Tax=Sordaria brevicollis TaxID=83679 RepID=A0AAE0NV36_SORBR|nr:hypothetical protein B0T20DRAFT_365746 [Sordaria brevicollis]